jgi:hypothetical protein
MKTPDVTQACDASAALASPSAISLVISTVSLPVQAAAQGEHPVIRVAQHFGSPIAAVRITDAAALAALAVAVAWFGIRINAWYGGTLGRTPEAKHPALRLSVSADVLALVLPTTARTLWTDRWRMAAAVASALWTITIAVAPMATVGFAALASLPGAIEAVLEIRRDSHRDGSCLPPHHRIGPTYLPIQVATVSGVQTSRPV